MKHPKLSRGLFRIAILTVVTVFAWITFDTYRTFTKKEMPKILQRQIEPLNPTVDRQTLENLANRTTVNVGDLLLPSSMTPVNQATMTGGMPQ